MNSANGSTPGSEGGSIPGSTSGTSGSSGLSGTSGSSTTGETVVSTPGGTLSTSAGAGAGSAGSSGSTASGDLGSTSGGDQKSERLAKVKGEASRLRGEAGTRARGAAEEGKAKASETLGSLARSTRDAAGQFSGTQAEPLTRYVDSAANSLEDLARRIDEKSVDELLDDAREMVRRSPAIAIGAAVAAGFILSRFLKASGSMSGGTSSRSSSSFDTAGSSRPPSQGGMPGGNYDAAGESNGTPPVYNA